jgi:glycosyltransferase involved in cell wall biosynthesis
VAKVALVTHWDWFLYNYRLPLAELLRDHGADVTCVTPDGPYVAKLRAAGFRWLRWPVVRRSLNPLREAVAISRLAALYRRESFAAVQHVTIKPALYGSIAARRARIPVTVNNFAGLGFLFSDSRTAALLRPAVLPVLRVLSNRPSVYTVFENPYDRRHFVRRGLAPADRATAIIGTGIDTRQFAPSPNGHAPDDAPVVLMAGRLLVNKGVREFVQAAQRLRARGVAARFWVAGVPDRGSPTCIPEDEIEAWRREGTVEFLGHQEDVAALLRQASIGVLPTSYQEGVPRFLLEAAATGLPLVATDIEGCRMVVRPGVNGLLVPPKDVAALAEALAQLLGDADLRVSLGRAGRDLVVREYAEERVMARYVALYRHLGII